MKLLHIARGVYIGANVGPSPTGSTWEASVGGYARGPMVSIGWGYSAASPVRPWPILWPRMHRGCPLVSLTFLGFFVALAWNKYPSRSNTPIACGSSSGGRPMGADPIKQT